MLRLLLPAFCRGGNWMNLSCGTGNPRNGKNSKLRFTIRSNKTTKFLGCFIRFMRFVINTLGVAAFCEMALRSTIPTRKIPCWTTLFVLRCEFGAKETPLFYFLEVTPLERLVIVPCKFGPTTSYFQQKKWVLVLYWSLARNLIRDGMNCPPMPKTPIAFANLGCLCTFYCNSAVFRVSSGALPGHIHNSRWMSLKSILAIKISLTASYSSATVQPQRAAWPVRFKKKTSRF